MGEGLQVVDPPGDVVLGAQAPPQPGVGRDRQGQALGAQPGLVDAGRDGSGQFGRIQPVPDALAQALGDEQVPFGVDAGEDPSGAGEYGLYMVAIIVQLVDIN